MRFSFHLNVFYLISRFSSIPQESLFQIFQFYMNSLLLDYTKVHHDFHTSTSHKLATVYPFDQVFFNVDINRNRYSRQNFMMTEEEGS